VRGEHEVLEECKWDDRPDLIVHDSRGFEAASEGEMQLVESFLKEKSSKIDPKERLHVIWLVCILEALGILISHLTRWQVLH